MGAIRIVLAAVITSYSLSTWAVLPDSGWYWNPTESGRGFNIEIQDNVLFMAGFVYDSAGKPTWFATGGPMATDSTYTGSAFQTMGGQPLGGAYIAPSIVPFGAASITFPTTTTAVISVNGYTFNVIRQQFGFDFGSIFQPLLGEWSIVQGTLGIWFGQRIMFTGTIVSNGSVFAAGHMSGDLSRLAVGQLVAGQWSILLDSSPSYYTLYVFTFDGFNLVEGQSAVYLKTALPTGTLPAVGFRTKSAQAAAGLNAPGTIYKAGAAAAPQTISDDTRLAAMAANQQVGLSIPTAQLRALEEALLMTH